MKKKIYRFIIFHDWLWSVLACFLLYWATNWGPPSILGVPMTYYAINWIQALMATAGVIAGLCFIGRIAMWFYFRRLHDYIYGYRNPHEPLPNKPYKKYLNPSFFDFVKQLTPWQRMLLAFCCFVFLFVSALIVFLKFLSAGSVQP